MNSPLSLYTAISTSIMSLNLQKLLVANRGEIALRVLQSAKRLGLSTVSIYTKVDALSPHVAFADEAVLLRSHEDDLSVNTGGYRDAEAIVEICVEHNITLVHPGYGFLAENADFAEMLEGKGITLLGPTSQVIREMGLKHEARALAKRAGIPIVPGSESLLHALEGAVDTAEQIGYPIMLKATAGGGGMGLIVCGSLDGLVQKFSAAQERAKVSYVYTLITYTSRSSTSSLYSITTVYLLSDISHRLVILKSRYCSRPNPSASSSNQVPNSGVWKRHWSCHPYGRARV